MDSSLISSSLSALLAFETECGNILTELENNKPTEEGKLNSHTVTTLPNLQIAPIEDRVQSLYETASRLNKMLKPLKLPKDLLGPVEDDILYLPIIKRLKSDSGYNYIYLSARQLELAESKEPQPSTETHARIDLKEFPQKQTLESFELSGNQETYAQLIVAAVVGIFAAIMFKIIGTSPAVIDSTHPQHSGE